MPEPDGVVLAYVHPGTHVQHSFLASLLGVVITDQKAHRRLDCVGGPLAVRCSTGDLRDARNQAAKFLLDSTAKWLLFIDTDMGFHPDTMERLLATADRTCAKIVGGLTFGWRSATPDGMGGFLGEPFPVMFEWQKDPEGQVCGVREIEQFEPGSVVQVAATGAACLLIHREVLEKIASESGPVWFDHTTYVDGRRVSEDLSFCFRAAAVGEPIVVDTSIRTSHAKTIWVDDRVFVEHLVTQRAIDTLTEGGVPCPT